jgi:hypothetical protein
VLLRHITGVALDDPGPRIEVLVDPVSESHEPERISQLHSDDDSGGL